MENIYESFVMPNETSTYHTIDVVVALGLDVHEHKDEVQHTRQHNDLHTAPGGKTHHVGAITACTEKRGPADSQSPHKLHTT